jgi:SAM-dependent methyltransferase
VASRGLAIQTIDELCPADEPLVLDEGCSSGFLLEELRARVPRAAVMGADYIEPPLRKLASQGKGVPLLQFDLRHCPLPDASLDGIVCLNVLEHIDDDTAALKNIWRLLKPGGIAHIEVPAGPRLYDLYDEVLMHHRRYRMGELIAMADQTGFEVVRATHLGFFVYPAFALKKLWNRRWSRATPETKRRLVAAQIRKTSASGALGILLKLEIVLGRRFRFPWGIRCVLVLRKQS